VQWCPQFTGQERRGKSPNNDGGSDPKTAPQSFGSLFHAFFTYLSYNGISGTTLFTLTDGFDQGMG
jgi:hypothetical protein